MRNQSNCLICFDEPEEFQTLSCGCQLCQNCLFHWAKSYSEDNILSEEIILQCPFDKCRKPIPIDQYLPLLNASQADIINNCLLKSYLTHQKDIQICPKQNCNFAGISGYLPESCHYYICQKCNTYWTAQSQVGGSDSLKKYLYRLSVIKNEMLSDIAKLITGNLCPNCSVYVTKNGGCSHMVCKKCKYEFC